MYFHLLLFYHCYIMNATLSVFVIFLYLSLSKYRLRNYLLFLGISQTGDVPVGNSSYILNYTRWYAGQWGTGIVKEYFAFSDMFHCLGSTVSHNIEYFPGILCFFWRLILSSNHHIHIGSMVIFSLINILALCILYTQQLPSF